MKNKKIIYLLLISLIAILPLVSASLVIIDSWNIATRDTPTGVDNVTNNAIGQPFNGTLSELVAINFYIYRVGACSGATARLDIYLANPGDFYKPTGSVLVSSTNTLDLSTVTTNTNFNPYAFNFDNYALSNGVVYFAVLNCTGLNGSNYIFVAADGGNTLGYYDTAFRYTNQWIENSGYSFCYYAYAVEVESPTPTPTPSPTPDAMPNWISDIIDAIIPIFTPLLVIFICGALGWRFAGAWGFFAGINLAIILVYVIAPTYMPLWAIVAVVIVDIALLFGKVGFDRR